MVAFDSAGPATAASTTSPLTWTHTTVASGCTLIVAIDLDSDNNNSTTVKCDGVAMTSLGLMDTNGGTADPPTTFHAYLKVFWISGIASGAHTITATVTGTVGNTILGGSLAYSSAGTLGTAVFTQTPTTATVTAAATSRIAFFFTAGNSITATSGATSEFVNNNQGNGPLDTGNLAGADAAGTGGAVTCTWTTAATSHVSFGIEVTAGAAAPSSVPQYAIPGKTWSNRFRTLKYSNKFTASQPVFAAAQTATASASALGAVNPPAYVQDVGYTATASTGSVVLTVGSGISGFVPTTQGNRLVLWAKSTSGFAATGITDSRGNTWEQDVPTQSGTATISLWSAYLSNPLQPNDTITVSFNGTGTAGAGCAEFTRLSSTVPDQTAENHVTGTPGGVTVTTSAFCAQTNEIVVAAAASSGGTWTDPLSDPLSGGIWNAEVNPPVTATFQALWQLSPKASTFSAALVNAGAANMEAAIASYQGSSLFIQVAMTPAPLYAAPGKVWSNRFRTLKYSDQFLNPPAPSAGTNVNAGLASATATALGQDTSTDAQAQIAPNATTAAATGTSLGTDTSNLQLSIAEGFAYPPDYAEPGELWREHFQHRQILAPNSVAVTAGLATATGTAYGQDDSADAQAQVAPNAAVVTGTATALGEDTAPDFQLSIAEGASYQPDYAQPGEVWREHFQHRQILAPQSVAVTAGLASATATSLGQDTSADAQAQIAPNAAIAAATATALGQDQGADIAMVSPNAAVAAATATSLGEDTAPDFQISIAEGEAYPPDYAQPGEVWREHFQHRQILAPPAPAQGTAFAQPALATATSFGQDNSTAQAQIAPNAAVAVATGISLGADNTGANSYGGGGYGNGNYGTGIAPFELSIAEGFAYPSMLATPGQVWRKFYQHRQILAPAFVPPSTGTANAQPALATATSLGQDNSTAQAQIAPNATNATAQATALGTDTAPDFQLSIAEGFGYPQAYAQPGQLWRKFFRHAQQLAPSAVAVTAGLASATATALGQDNGNDLASVAPNAAVAAATGTSLGEDTAADFQISIAEGEAYPPDYAQPGQVWRKFFRHPQQLAPSSVAVTAGLASATATALGTDDLVDNLASVTVNAQVAAAVAASQDVQFGPPPVPQPYAAPGNVWRKFFHHPQLTPPLAQLFVFAGVATATATAQGQDTGSNLASVAPNATTAAATGTAQGQDTGADLASVAVNAGNAAATGVALGQDNGNDIAAVSVNALNAAATATAYGVLAQVFGVAPPVYAQPGDTWRKRYQHIQILPPAPPFVPSAIVVATGFATVRDVNEGLATQPVDSHTAVAVLTDPREGTMTGALDTTEGRSSVSDPREGGAGVH